MSLLSLHYRADKSSMRMRTLLLHHACHMEGGVASSPLLASENLRFIVLRTFAEI
jgi:hypothetical protein